MWNIKSVEILDEYCIFNNNDVDVFKLLDELNLSYHEYQQHDKNSMIYVFVKNKSVNSCGNMFSPSYKYPVFNTSDYERKNF